MSRSVKQLCCGVVPIIVGYLYNLLIAASAAGTISISLVEHMGLISFILLFLWALLAYFVSARDGNIFTQAFLMCAMGLIMLILVQYQLNVLEAFWLNTSGAISQSWFLPAFSAAGLVFGEQSAWILFAASFALMYVFAVIGCLVKKLDR